MLCYGYLYYFSRIQYNIHDTPGTTSKIDPNIKKVILIQNNDPNNKKVIPITKKVIPISKK